MVPVRRRLSSGKKKLETPNMSVSNDVWSKSLLTEIQLNKCDGAAVPVARH